MACFALVNGGYSTIVTCTPLLQGTWSGGRLDRDPARRHGPGPGRGRPDRPVLTQGEQDRRRWLRLTLTPQEAGGFFGLAAGLDLTHVASAVCVGAGLGSSFALTMIVSLDHLPNPAAASALTGAMQRRGFM